MKAVRNNEILKIEIYSFRGFGAELTLYTEVLLSAKGNRQVILQEGDIAACVNESGCGK